MHSTSAQNLIWFYPFLGVHPTLIAAMIQWKIKQLWTTCLTMPHRRSKEWLFELIKERTIICAPETITFPTGVKKDK